MLLGAAWNDTDAGSGGVQQDSLVQWLSSPALDGASRWGLFGGRIEMQGERKSFQKSLKSWRGDWTLSWKLQKKSCGHHHTLCDLIFRQWVFGLFITNDVQLLNQWETWGKCFKLNCQVLQRRQWQPTPVFLPGKSTGRRSLVGCSPWGR